MIYTSLPGRARTSRAAVLLGDEGVDFGVLCVTGPAVSGPGLG